MPTPTTLAIQTFSRRAEGQAHAILQGGEAPRMAAFDDTVGCPMEQATAALEATRVVGVLLDDDLLFAGRLTSDTAAAVVERRTEHGRRWCYYGPRMETWADAPPEGEVIIDQPGLFGLAFVDRALALAHFLRATAGTGALLAQLGRRPPEVRHLRRWLPPILDELDTPRRLIAGWFAASAGGALFIGEDDLEGETSYRYIEVGINS